MNSLTAQETVLRSMRHLIATGELEPGQQVIQDSLATQLGVSRVPLREALKVLEGEGQVVYHPHRGYFVADLSVADLVEVYRIRGLLEAEALAVGIPQMTNDDLELIAELMHEVEKATTIGDVAAVTQANRRFHFAMYEASNMPRLVRMIRTLWDATDAYRSVYMANSTNLDHMNLEHKEMLRVLQTGNVEKFIELQAAHRENSVSAVSKVIGR